MKAKATVAVLALCIVVQTGRAQKDKSIDSLMKEAYGRGIFNGNILVSQKGKTVYQNSFGYADGKKSRALTKDLKFDIGSISKEFNGVAIMQLSEKGLLSLEDNVSIYFPEFSPWAKEVRTILIHRSINAFWS